MLKIAERHAQDITVLDLSGQLGFGFESQTLCNRVHQLVSGQVTRILLNLAGVTLIDSCGVAELISCLTAVKKVGGMLKLSGATTQVMDVLRITRVVKVLDHYESEQAALASFVEP